MTMISPFEGRLTQNHADSGGYPGHRGQDIAPPKPGQTGLPVYAAFGGTVIRVVKGIPHGNKTSTLAPGRTPNGAIIKNRDGEAQLYGHVNPTVRVGDVVEAGDLIGYNDRSGNQTAPHLHFECWADWRNHASDYDPALCFKKFGVKPGSKPVLPSVKIEPVASVTPVKKPATAAPKATSTNRDIQRKLAGMGLWKGAITGVNDAKQKKGVKAFQKAHGLTQDGVWGNKSEARYDWNVALQNALKRMAGVPDTWKSDGFVGKTTKKWRAYTIKRQGWGKPNNGQLQAKLRAVGAWK